MVTKGKVLTGHVWTGLLMTGQVRTAILMTAQIGTGLVTQFMKSLDRSGKVGTKPVKFGAGWVKPGHVKSGVDKPSQVWAGKVKCGQVKSINTGQVRLTQVKS